MSTRETTNTLKSAMTSTDTMASDADDHVDPHNRANCTIDLVSSSMKPAPRKKKWAAVRRSTFDVRRSAFVVRDSAFDAPTTNDEPRTTNDTAARDIRRTTASAAK